MSRILDQAACEDAQRREDLARSDAELRDWPQRIAAAIASAYPLETAHGIKRTGLAHVSGVHIGDAANEPTDADFIAADLARNESKGERLARLNDLHAMDLQVALQGYIGELPR